MARNRNKSCVEQFDANVARHVETLGLKSVEEYQQWCASNGFSRRLKKSQADRRRERNAVYSGPRYQHQQHSPGNGHEEQELVRVFGERINRSGLNSKQRSLLFATVKRLQTLAAANNSAESKALKELFFACLDRRVKFSLASKPPRAGFVTCTYLEALASIAHFKYRWIRPLSEWKVRTHNPRRQFISLLRHLFVAHSVPAFLFSVWLRRDLRISVKNQSAFTHIAAGHSVRRLKLPLEFTKRMGHYFMHAPNECTFHQALRWGQIHGLGGDETLARVVMSTFLGSNFSNEAFWKTVIQWFVDHPMFDRHWFHVVIDYLSNQKFGTGEMARIEHRADGRYVEVPTPPAQPNLRMNGRTPTALLRDVNRWHRQLQAVDISLGGAVWQHSGIKELRLTEGEKKPTIWTIRQLLTASAMVQEGRKMNHCVASYVHSCVNNRTSIWSMRKEHEGTMNRVLTIEVGLTSLNIRQIRGKNNRVPTESELKLIRRWAQVADLKLNSFI